MLRATAALGLATFMLLAVGCDSGDEVRVRLQALQSCGEVEQAIRQSALDEMNRTLDTNEQNAGQGYYCGGGGLEDAAGGSRNYAPSAPTTSAAAGESKSGGASQVSTTNNQVAGVDEADFIKNDNQYIYMVSAGAFRIIEAWPAPAAHAIGRLDIEGTPRKLFVSGDVALVYSSLQPPSSTDPNTSGGATYPGGWQECTYGYDCQFTGDGNPTKITIVDISDRTAPRVVRELRTSASLLAARRIGSAVHTVLSAPGPTFTGLNTWPQDLGCDPDPVALHLAFEALRQANTKIIMETPVADLLPTVVDTQIEGTQRYQGPNLLGACQGFYKPNRTDGSSFTTVLSLDLDRSAAPVMSTIISRPGAVYASSSALYMAVTQQRNGYDWFSGVAGDEATVVHRFDLESGPAGSSYAGSGLVEGHVLSQFAMDEYQGYLRIATSNGQVPSPDVHSALTVMRLQGGALAVTGVVDQIAPEEDIRAVRFDGDRGYVVTFKKTDPLYVFDLSNPFSPRELAELKVDGFSTYMQMMDATHLLTIGYDASDQGDFAWFTGVRLQIFDVASPSAPRLVAVELIGTRGTSSEALTNHLAVNYFAPKQLLALPMTVCEGGDQNGGYGDTMSFSGLMVYRVTPDSGFSLTGKVDHPADGATCYNWWADAGSSVKRSIVMDDYVYSVSEKRIKVNNLANLSQDVMVIPVDN